MICATEPLVLPVRLELTPKLFLRQLPLPIGLWEYIGQEDRDIPLHLMPPDWEGRNRTLKHLIQSQAALPVCVLPRETACRSLGITS